MRVLLLRSVTHSDLKFSISDGVARWDESLLFPFAPLSSTPVVSSGFCRMFPGFYSCFCIRGFLSSLSYFCVVSFRSVGGCRCLHLFCVFLSFSCAGLLVVCLACPLPFFHVPSLGFSSFVLGFSVPGISLIVPVSLHS